MNQSIILRSALCLAFLLPISALNATPQAPKQKATLKKHAKASKPVTAARPAVVNNNAVKPMGKSSHPPKPKSAN